MSDFVLVSVDPNQIFAAPGDESLSLGLYVQMQDILITDLTKA